MAKWLLVDALGVVLILVSVVVFPLATRWAVFRAKGRAVAAGAGILGRLVKVLAVLSLRSRLWCCT